MPNLKPTEAWAVRDTDRGVSSINDQLKIYSSKRALIRSARVGDNFRRVYILDAEEYERLTVPTIRRDEDGSVDEVIGVAHLERMGDDDEWCLIFGEGTDAVIFDVAGKVVQR